MWQRLIQCVTDKVVMHLSPGRESSEPDVDMPVADCKYRLSRLVLPPFLSLAMPPGQIASLLENVYGPYPDTVILNDNFPRLGVKPPLRQLQLYSGKQNIG
jgi:hypothetical protein